MSKREPKQVKKWNVCHRGNCSCSTLVAFIVECCFLYTLLVWVVPGRLKVKKGKILGQVWSPEDEMNNLLTISSLFHRNAGRSLWRTSNEGRSAALSLWSLDWGLNWRPWWSRTQRGPHSFGPSFRVASVGSPSGCGLTFTSCWQWTQAPTRSMGKC